MFLVELSDLDIQRDVLGWPGLDEKTVSETVPFNASKEVARNVILGRVQLGPSTQHTEKGRKNKINLIRPRASRRVNVLLEKTATSMYSQSIKNNGLRSHSPPASHVDHLEEEQKRTS